MWLLLYLQILRMNMDTIRTVRFICNEILLRSPAFHDILFCGGRLHGCMHACMRLCAHLCVHGNQYYVIPSSNNCSVGLLFANPSFCDRSK